MPIKIWNLVPVEIALRRDRSVKGLMQSFRHSFDGNLGMLAAFVGSCLLLRLYSSLIRLLSFYDFNFHCYWDDVRSAVDSHDAL